MTILSEETKFRGYLVFSNIVLLAVLFFILPKVFHGMGKALFERRDVACNMISTFSIALVGILAGIVVVVTSMPDSAYTRYFREKNHRGDYIFCYGMTILFIIYTHCTTILALSSFWWFKMMIASMVLNILQAITLAISAHFIARSNPAKKEAAA